MLNGAIKRFWDDQRGYVIALTLIAMPLLLGFSLLVIDVGRGNNLHTDLQNAVDALALAGARELDGSSNSIIRAEVAMSNLVKNQARFSNGGPVLIEADEVEWYFLTEIPASDDTAIDVDWIGAYQTTEGTDAIYVMVVSHERPMTALFPLPVGLTKDTVDFGASAVATYDVAACDVTPIFICNPYEGDGLSFEEAFSQGLTYGKEFRLLKTDATPGPGNFGLLDTEIPLREAFAKGTAGTCYSRTSITTKPGVTLGHVNVGLNVRFDIYAGPLSQMAIKEDPAYRPAVNVRKGAQNPKACNKFTSADDGSAMGFPPGQGTDRPGVSGPNWDYTTYWQINHGGTMPPITSNSHPTSANHWPPSRYDVYRYEIKNNLVGDKAGGKNNGETGIPQCVDKDVELTEQPDRRIIFGAVVDCNDFRDPTKSTTINGKTSLKPDAFASFFLTNPIEKEDKTANDDGTGAEKPIRLEVVDVTGNKGRGTLDTFIREEAYLVR